MQEKNIETFKKDIIFYDGYKYSKEKLSCQLSNNRINKSIKELLGCIKGKKILDIGCGDGAFTKTLIDLNPAFVTGIDPNDAAIEIARKNTNAIINIEFNTMDVYSIPLIKKYDIAIIRGVLHHLYQLEKAIEIICKISDQIIIVEPNGYNPILKIIERISPYHRAHEEKSYFPRKLDRLFMQNGGELTKSFYIGLIPMFCPDFMAKILHFLEPSFEKIPLLRTFSCGQYIQKISIKN